VLNELIEEYIPKLRSELYDAMRNVSMDSTQSVEEEPEVAEPTMVKKQPLVEEKFVPEEEPEVEVEYQEPTVDEQPAVEEEAPKRRRGFLWGKRDAE
jgi:hypothetical protein